MTETITIEISNSLRPDIVKDLFEQKLANFTTYRYTCTLFKHGAAFNEYNVSSDGGCMAFYHIGAIAASIIKGVKNKTTLQG